MIWDIFSQQPLKCYHPALEGGWYALAAVAQRSKERGGGVVLWNADYIISANMPGGMPGSGFPYTIIEGEPEYDTACNMWLISSKPGRVYRLALPDSRMLAQWEEYKQYVPLLDELQGQSDQLT